MCTYTEDWAETPHRSHSELRLDHNPLPSCLLRERERQGERRGERQRKGERQRRNKKRDRDRETSSVTGRAGRDLFNKRFLNVIFCFVVKFHTVV